jgi:hypothetical protein
MLDLGSERGKRSEVLWSGHSPLESSRALLRNAEFVRVADTKTIEALASTLEARHPHLWGKPYLTVADGFSVDDVFTFSLGVTALNFCFWDPEGGPDWRVEGGRGANALIESFVRAHGEGLGVTDPAWYEGLGVRAVEHLLRGDSAEQPGPPLILERTQILNEMGEWLRRFKSPGEVLEGNFSDAFGFAEFLGRSLEGFRDVGYVAGEEPIPFLKRAQMYASAVGPLLGEKSPAFLGKRERLTMFADYRLPQSERNLGVLEYSPELAEKVDSEELIEPGSRAENEIRAGCVVGGEELRQALNRQGGDWEPADVDAMLWVYGRTTKEIEPYHRCLTIWY